MDKLEYVLTLAEERNMTRAASRLFISQPTLTNYINRLEKELGVKLFDRTVQPIKVTQAGLIYIEDMKKIQNRQSALKLKLQSLARTNETFRIGVPPIRGAYRIPKAIREFLEIYPDVSIMLDNQLENELEKGLVSGQIDIAIGALSSAYPGIHYECIEEAQTYLLVPRSASCVAHLSSDEGTLENPYLLDFNCLNGQNLLLPRAGGGHYRITMLILEKYGIVPKTTMHCSNINTLYQVLGEGFGFMFATPTPFMETYPQYTDKIAFCVLEKEKFIQRAYVGYPEDNQNIHMIQDFVKLVKKHLWSHESGKGVQYPKDSMYSP